MAVLSLFTMRVAEKEMKRYFGIFETCLLTINHALESQKTKVKKLENLKNDLKTNFYEFDAAFRVHKADVVAKDCDSVGGFNGKAQDGTDNFACNDSWAKEQLEVYLVANWILLKWEMH